MQSFKHYNGAKSKNDKIKTRKFAIFTFVAIIYLHSSVCLASTLIVIRKHLTAHVTLPKVAIAGDTVRLKHVVVTFLVALLAYFAILVVFGKTFGAVVALVEAIPRVLAVNLLKDTNEEHKKKRQKKHEKK